MTIINAEMHIFDRFIELILIQKINNNQLTMIFGAILILGQS